MPSPSPFSVFHAALSCLCLTASCHAVQVGQTEAQVIKELGEPGMKTPLGPKGVIWGYKHGTLVMRSGRVASLDFRSAEQIATVEREEKIAEQRSHARRLAEDLERAQAAEAQARVSALHARSLAFREGRQAVLFNPMKPVDGAARGGVRVQSVMFSYGKTEEYFVDTGGGGAYGDRRQSVGGGGGVGLSGRAGYVVPSVEYVSLWLVVDADGSALGHEIVAAVAFTNRLSVSPASYRVSFSRIDRRADDAPSVHRFRADMQISDDKLPGEIFARSDGLSFRFSGVGFGDGSKSSDWQSVSPFPAPPRM